MFITNIRHLINASKTMGEEMPAEARDLSGFITLVVESTTKTVPQTLTLTDVTCFRKGCDGQIKSSLRPDNGEIHWFCPDCEEEGLINNWQGTEWDHRSEINS
jgi:hypothetical protein